VKATPLGIHNRRAVRDLLLTHGWERGKAEAAASGIAGAAVHVSGLTGDALERLIGYAGPKLGLDVLTGEDWAIVAGSMARLSAFARPWSGPAELVEAWHASARSLARGQGRPSWSRSPPRLDGPSRVIYPRSGRPPEDQSPSNVPW
jgi:hypothetical protein